MVEMVWFKSGPFLVDLVFICQFYHKLSGMRCLLDQKYVLHKTILPKPGTWYTLQFAVDFFS